MLVQPANRKNPFRNPHQIHNSLHAMMLANSRYEPLRLVQHNVNFLLNRNRPTINNNFVLLRISLLTNNSNLAINPNTTIHNKILSLTPARNTSLRENLLNTLLHTSPVAESLLNTYREQ